MNDNDVQKAIAWYDAVPESTRANPCFLSSYVYKAISKQGLPSPERHRSSTDEINDSQSQYNNREWNFELPRIRAPHPQLQNVKPDGSARFELLELIGAIQAGETVERIGNYLAFHYQRDGSELKRLINADVKGFPAFFYVLETRNAELIRIWGKHGGDVNTTYGITKVPLLAYAIAVGDSFQNDTRDTVATLLGLGASVDPIPRAFYNPLERDLPESGPSSTELADLDDANKAWCTPAVLKKLSRSLNFCFTTRYYLRLSSLIKPYSGAQRQVVQMRKSEDLLGIHYSLIGQTAASTFLVKTMLRYLAMPTKRPIVMMFAGPSGHGKTELAQRFGSLLSLKFHTVDCTSMQHVFDMFGGRAPYLGHEQGSALNNFLASNDGSRSIVFLDEFEKTSDEIRNALLIPLQSGSYEDHRNLRMVDCSQTVWIFATNAFDPTIHEFCKRNEAALFDLSQMDESEKLVSQLSKEIRRESKGHFGAPLTGRVTVWLPFLTFSPVEQAVVADKYLADFGREALRPVRLAGDEARDRLVGGVRLDVRQGYSLCAALARAGYQPALGARSLAAEVDERVRGPVVDAYLQDRDEITEATAAGAGTGTGTGTAATTHCLASVDADGEVEVACAVVVPG